ncbi:MAG: aspartate aminotransferase family protein [Flavobacteriales bacterium]|nr:aspartate aminotransferase family protein [Flavobacteriales bacterium]
MSLEKSKSEALFARRNKVVTRGVGVFNTITAVSAKDATIIDHDGKSYIDFAGGIGVVNSGHCPEPVVEAIKRQAEQYIHTSFNVVTYEPYVKLCEDLVDILPHDGDTKALLVSTGAEAVENAIKIARQATGRQAVLCYTDAFHGRTMMAMTLTSKIGYKLNCGPFAPEVYRIPFPNYYRYGKGMTKEEFIHKEVIRLKEISLNLVDPNNLAAIIIEPIQGEGGFCQVPQEYLKELRAFCDEHGVMLILDEIQSGFGRTGNWASWQEYGVVPDISTYAKSLGSGLPIAAVLGKAHIMDSVEPGTVGGTYIGNPVCCAAAIATIQYMKDLNLNDRAKWIGSIINDRFEKLKNEFNEIGDVRSFGAMNAMVFVHDSNPNKPNGELCNEIRIECAKNGLILVTAGTYKNIIRILAPIVISEEQLNQGLDILENSIRNVINR